MLFHFLVFFLIFKNQNVEATIPDSFSRKDIHYRTFFADCPSKSSGALALLLIKEFEKDHSLKDVKEKILAEKLEEKYFLSSYKLNYNPVAKMLKMNFECPYPLAKIQVYKSTGEEHYSAILADNARMYEPQYENLMRVEKKLTHPLPSLALPPDIMELDAPKELSEFLKKINPELRNKISEMIINKNNELTIIFALADRATSVFLGGEPWDEKLSKLTKIVAYVGRSKRYPSSINLVNSKKVVVKFSDKI